MSKNHKKEFFSGNIKDHDIDFWIEKEYNVLFEGLPGVGKTARILEAFKRNNLVYKYFSASTMDPWTDLIGVPKEMKEGDKSFLEFVRPREMEDGSIQAIFLDEYNRSQKKVRNAVMELIQFKSINGKKFPNLKIVWVACNPADDDNFSFDVEALDPAQEDRFHIQVQIPYKSDLAYFQKTYGEEVGKSAVDWWDGLEESMKLMVTPRRLDMALRVYRDGGNIRHALPANCPVAKLLDAVNHGLPEESLRRFMSQNDTKGARRWLAHVNNLNGVKTLIAEDREVRKFTLPLLEEENATNLIVQNKAIKDEVSRNPQEYAGIIRILAEGSQHKKIKKEFQAISKALEQYGEDFVNDGNIANVIIDNSKSLPQHFTKTEQQSMKANFRFKDNIDISTKEFNGDANAEIRDIATKTMSATNHWLKIRLYESLCAVSTEKLTADQGKAVVRICNFLASVLQSNTLGELADFPICFNTAVNCIHKENPDFTVEELFNLCPYLFFSYFSKNNKSIPKNVGDLMIEPKPKNEWVETKDEELEGIEI